MLVDEIVNLFEQVLTFASSEPVPDRLKSLNKDLGIFSLSLSSLCWRFRLPDKDLRLGLELR